MVYKQLITSLLFSTHLSGKKLIIDKIAWRFALLAIFSSLYQGFAVSSPF